MANINLGRVSPLAVGEYDSTITYDKLDIVNYQGSSYIAKKGVPAGTSITNDEYWQLLAEGAGQLSIGTVNTVSASTGASASITGSYNAPVLNLNIPRGVAGNESIDDTAGVGDTDKVWSADKSYRETTDLKNSIQSQINDIITGDVTINYNYTIDNLITQLPNFTNYSGTSSSFIIETDKITVKEPISTFLFYINPFNYSVGDHLIGNVKMKVNSKTNTTNQRVNISFANYTSTGSDIVYGAAVYMQNNRITYGTLLGSTMTTIGNASIDEIINIPIDIGVTTTNTKNKFIQINSSNPTDDTFSIDILEVNVWVDDGRGEKTVVKYSENAETAEHANYADAVAGKLNNKTWGAIGDSLTASYFDAYVSYIEDNTGITATNYGVGGTCVANNISADVTPSFVDRVCGLNGQSGYNDSFDLWTVFGGANDIIKSTPIGTINDSSDTTFYGALNLIVQHLLGLPNNPTVALIAPYYIYGHSSYSEYCEAIEKIANKYGLMFLDLSKISGINSVNRTVYLRDGVHPTQDGVDKIRPIMLEWFNSIRLSESTTPMPH